MNHFLIKYFFILFILTLNINCKKHNLFQPVQHSDDEFMKSSKENGKKLQEKERKYIKNWINKSNLQGFEESKSGFWIIFTKNTDFPNAKELNLVKYNIQIEDFLGNIIYTYDELGPKQCILGKSYEIRGVEKTLRMMGEGDETTILLPSFMGYGLYGDENKIGKNKPLIIHLKMNEVLEVKPKN